MYGGFACGLYQVIPLELAQSPLHAHAAWQPLTAEQARTARSTPARLGGLQGRGRARHALQLVRGRAVVRARGEDALQVGLGRGEAARLRQDAAPGAASRASGPQEGLSCPSHALIRRCMPYPWSHMCRLTEPQ